MPPASVNTIPRPVMSQIDTNPSMMSLRDFVADEEAAQFSNTLWHSIDHSAFINAQREAIEAYNMNKALRLSEETAAVESIRRAAAAASSSVSAPTTIITITPPDSRPGSSSASESAKPKSPAISHHDRKPSSSASAQAARTNFHSQPRLSLSTTHTTSLSVDNSASAYTSRASNSVSSSSASQSLASQTRRIDQRSLSKREPESPATKISITMSPSSSASTSSISHTQAPDTANSKRRRTERQTSISSNMPSASQQPQQQHLVVPAIIDSKKSTASVRLTNPPPTPVDPPPRHQSTAKLPSSTKPPAEPRDLFMTTRSCTKCGTPVPSPRSQPLVDGSNDIIALLHVTCTKCHTMHCRGCFAVARCNRALVLVSSLSTSSARSPTSTTHNDCAGSSTCTVRNCCAAVRAIAVFEALCAFDDVFASEAGFGSGAVDGKAKGKGKEYRDAYVRQIISRADLSGASKPDKEKTGARRFEDSFIRTLKAVSAWLQAPDDDDSDGGYTHRGKGKDASRAVHTSIPRLLASSLLLEVIHVFLSNTIVRDWVAHAEAYIAILDLLKWIFKASTSVSTTAVRPTSGSLWGDSLTLKSLLQSPLRRIEMTSGLRRCVWGDGNVRYEDIVVPTGSGHRQTPAPQSLCDLIRQLESHRLPLMALASKCTFEVTVGKVNNLCDGIIYLVLQLVVDDM